MAPPAGPDSTSRTGKRAAVSDRRDAAARRHQENGAGQAGAAELAFELAEIAADQRLQIGVGAGGREALVFAHLGRDLGRQRHRDIAAARGATASPTRRSCAGLVKLCSKPTATRLDSRAPRASRSRARCFARRAASAPRPARRSRSRIGSRSRRGTSGGGRSMLMSYCSKRFSWRISTTSRNPSVVSSAVFAPLRSISALVASVVPWMMSSTRRRARCRPRPGSNGRRSARRLRARAASSGSWP